MGIPCPLGILRLGQLTVNRGWGPWVGTKEPMPNSGRGHKLNVGPDESTYCKNCGRRLRVLYNVLVHRRRTLILCNVCYDIFRNDYTDDELETLMDLVQSNQRDMSPVSEADDEKEPSVLDRLDHDNHYEAVLAEMKDSQVPTQPIPVTPPERPEPEGPPPLVRRSGVWGSESAPINLLYSDEGSDINLPAPKRQRVFRMAAKKICFTIPQCDLTPEEVLNLLRNKFPTQEYFHYMIVRETHQDGNYHIHGYLKSGKKFDFTGNMIGDYVANFKRVWDEEGWLKYLNKEDGEKITNVKKGGMMACCSAEELWVYLRCKLSEAQVGRDYTRFHAAWVLLHQEAKEYNSPYDIASFNVPQAVTEWAKANVLNHDGRSRRSILIIVGPSRLGKTSMIRTMFPTAAYCKSRLNFDTIKRAPCGAVMILDDLINGVPGSNETPPDKAWTDVHPYNMTGRYRPMQEMKAMATVILCNELPKWRTDPYWQMNSTVVRVENPLYN